MTPAVDRSTERKRQAGNYCVAIRGSDGVPVHLCCQRQDINHKAIDRVLFIRGSQRSCLSIRRLGGSSWLWRKWLELIQVCEVMSLVEDERQRQIADDGGREPW